MLAAVVPKLDKTSLEEHLSDIRDGADRIRLLKRIQWLSVDPEARADGILGPRWTRRPGIYFKARVGRMRIIYQVIQNRMVIAAVGYRGSVYKKAFGLSISEF